MADQRDLERLLALTRALAGAVAREDLSEAMALLEERRVRLQALAEDQPADEAARARLASFRAEIQRVDAETLAALAAGLSLTSAQLARLDRSQGAELRGTVNLDRKA
jgi:hypothetical protein